MLLFSRLRNRQFQLLFHFFHVVIGIAVAFRLAEPHAVDDACMVERVGDDGVVLEEKRLEHTAVGVEARGVEYGILGMEERGDFLLEFLVDVLRSADEAHAGHTLAVRIERLLRRRDNLGMRGKPEVIVGAEV